MSTAAGTEPGSGEALGGTVSNSLTSLIPTFDPSTDSVEVWSQKVELLAKVWPSDKVTELITRLILNCRGSAFQKLQIRQQDLLKNDLKCVKLLVELVGGQFGQVPLEKKYEAAERALFRSIQKADESNDSYLARSDVAWSELLSQQPQMKLEELQAYITLRGSQLGSDDKKRVLIEAGAENGGVLTMQKVTAAIRLLGAGFFQDYTGTKKTKLKTYDQTAFVTEEDAEFEHEAYYAMDDDQEDELLDQLAHEGDEDAILVTEYEAAVSDTVQDDKELATALTAYQDARRRFSERFRNRGFWPVKPSKGKGKGKTYGKGKGGRNRKSLQDRILSSRCRLCGKMGHWKAECPERSHTSSIGSGQAASASMVSGASTMYASSSQIGEDTLGLEFLRLPQVEEDTPLDEPKLHECCFGVLSVEIALKGIKDRVRGSRTSVEPSHRSFLRNEEPRVVATSESVNSMDILFVSHGCSGVVDLGASKTVIGSEHVTELIQSLDKTTQSKLERCQCQMHFRFGNQGVLSSSQALVVPIGKAKVKIAIVPGKTPFLISNALLRGLQAVIDTHNQNLQSPFLKHPVKLSLTPRGLFLMDLNDLIVASQEPSGNRIPHNICLSETLEKGVKPASQSDNVVTCAAVQPQITNPEIKSQVGQSQASVKPSDQQTRDVRHQITHERFQQQEAESQGAHPCVNCDRGVQHVVARSSFSKSADQGRDPTSRHHAVRFVPTVADDSPVRQDPCREEVHLHVGERAAVDHVVRPALSQVREVGPSPDESLCGAESRRSRELESSCSSTCLNTECPDKQDTSEQGKGQITGQRNEDGTRGSGCRDPSRDCRVGGVGCSECRSRVGSPTRLSEGGRTDSSGMFGSRCSLPPRPSVEHGKHVTASDWSHPEDCQRENRSLMVEPLGSWEALIAAGDIDSHEPSTRDPQQSTMNRRFHSVLQRISQELEETCKTHNRIPGKQTDLFEVFCSGQSRLTQQVQQQQGSAFRFSKDRTDLMTTEGRKVLFIELVSRKPRHLWFSPECGPWSAWSNLNQMKSIELWDKINNERIANLEQLALGVVLLRYQRSQGNHFHWEQPGRSNMFRTPLLQELYTKTVAAEFDMCNLGELVDPLNGKLIKKAMVVMTTSEILQRALHGHHCKKNHDHQAIEGTTRHDGKVISRSTFTEQYPRKFVRYVARILLQKHTLGSKPIDWEKQEAMVTTASSHAPKRRRLSFVPTVRSQSQKHPRVTQEGDDNETKRIRLLSKGPVGKQSTETEISEWEQILRDISPKLPRVGRSEVKDSQILQRIQDLIGPQNSVKSVVGGKGMNRTTGPLRIFGHGEAPWRKLVYLHRNTGKVHGIHQWEKWEDLSKRQLVRTGYPSSVAITIFTGNPLQTSASEQLRDQQSKKR